jgi:hypothetical protein
MRYALISLSAVLAAGLAACGDDKPSVKQEEPTVRTAPAPLVDAAPAVSPTPDIPGGVMTKDELAANICFFTPEEVQAALGFTVSAGKPNTQNLASYGAASCRYDGQDNVLQINAFWIDPSQMAATRQSRERISAGDLERLPGDADGAYLQYQQELGGALHYIRRNVMVEIRPMTWRAGNEAMKAKLLALRRAP